jgi:CDP-glucose 4,6-dehydratase
VNPGFWKGRKVFLTGHTGFKGSWLSLWLQRLGADVCGYSIDIPTEPSLYEAARIGDGMASIMGDVRDLAYLRAAVDDASPEIVVHMAAQSLVRTSYAEPVSTYGTNVMGTVNVLEAARYASSIRVVIIVTSDKCYDNDERQRGYVEDEPMGGHDPYSSSKGCAELITAAYRQSFFNGAGNDGDRTHVASARAGNVIGGGDWAEDRLIPDVVKASRSGTVLAIRNPQAIRPWLFVLDPLNGYLTLAERLWAYGPQFASAWNFGPDNSDRKDVAHIVERLFRGLGSTAKWRHDASHQPHEATYLALDSSKARSRLSWVPALDLSTALEWIVEWYRRVEQSGNARGITLEQIDRFQQRAVQQ